MSYRASIPNAVEDKILNCALQLAGDEPARAMAWYDTFSNQIYQLEQNPQSYPLAPEDSFVQDYTVRQTTFDQYRILFRIEGDQVILLDFKRGFR